MAAIADKILDEYAALAVQTGIAVSAGQEVIINSPVECADFARRLMRAAYRAGSGDVTVAWSDEQSSRIRYDMAPAEVFDQFPKWRRELYVGAAERGAAFISIAAEDPEIFAGVEPERLLRQQRASGAALAVYRERVLKNANAWCVLAVPTAAWSKKVFPTLAADEAAAKLWRAILATVRVTGDGAAVDRWREHTDFLGRAAKWLNEWQFTALHYVSNAGTDLTVGLIPGHIWAGGAEMAADGRLFVANLPTEEVYTAPDRLRVDGVAAATKPLVYEGDLIEDFRVTFERGRAVQVSARRGEAKLKQLIAADEGAAYLGEVALVPYNSPIAQSGLLFYNTLFDENAACHLAFGKAYPTSLTGGAEMDEGERLASGLNHSIVHEDFMVGSADLAIDGITADGEKIPVFRQGNFVEFG